tara:strand:+ start:489 stop:929 length:441 start_codon:yes stop_codon:yes gene_type:complete
MAQRYAAFKGGVLVGSGHLKKTLTEIKAIKEVNGVVALAVTEQELELINAGCPATESGGVVTVVENPTWLAEYQEEQKLNQKKKTKRLFKDYREEIDTSDANASTYKTNLKNYFISNVKTPIETATDKAGVDAAVGAVDFNSVTQP